MPHAIQFIVEGTGAAPAADELNAYPELTIVEQPAPPGTTRSDLLTITANLVTVVGGSLAAAELIRQWYLTWKGKENKRIDKVVIVAGKQRLLLEDTTTDQLAKILETL